MKVTKSEQHLSLNKAILYYAEYKKKDLLTSFCALLIISSCSTDCSASLPLKGFKETFRKASQKQQNGFAFKCTL